jgi:CRISPR/Cas system endoribonuclease Cas6 (RAMP superfamily)
MHFATNVLDMFVSDEKPSMSKLLGEVIYNKEFDVYVLFSYSPQYAFYNEDVVGNKFLKIIGLLGEMFYR